MKSLITSLILVLGTLNLFTESNANAAGCSSHFEKKAEIECLPKDKECIESKKKELLNQVDA